MELSRRQTLGALGIAVVAAALPGSAAKAVTTPLIHGMGTRPRSTQGGGVWAEVHCEVGVTSVTARMLKFDGSVEIGRYTLALHPDTNPIWGRWEGPPLSGIPLGTYRVEYEATSTDGGVATRTGEFFLWWDGDHLTWITPTVIDHLHRTVTLTGQVVGRHPLTGEQAPLPGVRVDVEAVYTWYNQPSPPPPPVLVTTAADGTFTAQLTLAGAAEIMTRNHDHPRDNLILGGEGRRWVTVNAWPTRLTAELGAAQLNLGESTTFEGLVEAMVDGQWQPLAGHPIRIEFVPGSTGQAVLEHQLNTDDLGRFRVTVRPPSAGRYVAVFGRDEVDVIDEFFRSASASQNVAVRQPVRFSEDWFHVAPTSILSDNPGNFGMSCVIYTPLSPAVVEVHYRRSSSEDWQILPTTTVGYAIYNDGGQEFAKSFTLPGSGEVRAFAPQTNSTQPAASKTVSVHVPRLVTQRPPGGDDTTPALPPQRRY